MKGIILYKSVYGSTAQYAAWLRDDLGFEMVSFEDQKRIAWNDYDTVIIGCPVVMNKPFLSGWIARHWQDLKHSRVFLFTTSGAPPYSPAIENGYREAVPGEIRQKLTYLPIPGHFNYSRMRFVHKLMLQIRTLIQKNPETRKSMRRDMRNPVDNVERMALLQLINAVTSDEYQQDVKA